MRAGSCRTTGRAAPRGRGRTRRGPRAARPLAFLALWLPLGAAAAQEPADAVPDTVEAIEPVAPDRARLDEETRAALQAVFDRVPSLADVTVEVDAGVVHLRGAVTSGQAAERAVELAAAQEGVVFVDDQIREVTSLRRRLLPTLDRVRGYALDAVAALPLLVAAMVIVLLFGALSSLLGRWRGPRFLAEWNPFLQALIRRFAQLVVFFVGLVVALELLDATALVGALLGTAGLAGIAIGFAFKDIAENYLAGVLLSFRRPFSRNDHIVVSGQEGKVVRLTAREVILMTLDGNHVQLPNAIVFREPVLNYTRNPRRRLAFSVDIHPDSDLELAVETGISTLRGMTGVMADPPPSGEVRELAESTVSLRFFGWVDQREADFLRVRSEALRLVKRALEDAGISMPSPEYRVDLQGAGAPGARPAPFEAPEEPARRPPAAEPRQRDVSIDTTIDEQIEEEVESEPEEEDLLAVEETADGPEPP